MFVNGELGESVLAEEKVGGEDVGAVVEQVCLGVCGCD